MTDKIIKLNATEEAERRRRWRLALGKDSEKGLGDVGGQDQKLDELLDKLYSSEEEEEFENGEGQGQGKGGVPGQGQGQGAGARQGRGRRRVGLRAPGRGRGRGGQGGQGSMPGNGKQGGTGHGSGDGPSAREIIDALKEGRKLFPESVVQVIQHDALDQLGLAVLYEEPELISEIEPDVALASLIIETARTMPDKAREAAQILVQKVVDEIMKRLSEKLKQSVTGALRKREPTHRPKSEIDFLRTIDVNINKGNYLDHDSDDNPVQKLIVDELRGYKSRRESMNEIIVCVDQSGSMGESALYSAVFAAIMASLPSVKTRYVVFDTEVVDMTEKLKTPVDIFFMNQLGGGTDIARAIKYCHERVAEPRKTIFVLITDLYEGGNEEEMKAQAAKMVHDGVNFICLGALTDSGAPAYDEGNAKMFASLGIPVFACTPDLFPDLIANAIKREPIGRWAKEAGLAVTENPLVGEDKRRAAFQN